jgi:rhodanese-related sulfurtransferase
MKQFFQNFFKKKELKVDNFDVDPEQFHDLLQKKTQIKLIDVRRQEEYDQGHIQNAALLPVQELSQERIDALDIKKEDEILLYCRSGGRSGKALEQFLQLGYINTKHLAGGMLAWQEKRLPVKK